MSNLRQNDYKTEVQLGNIEGRVYWQAFGERRDLEVDVNGVDVWRGNELTPAASNLIPIPNDAGEAMSFTCEGATDTAGGVGVQEVTFECIDASGNELQIVKATNGGTVALGTNVKFINDMYTTAVGSNGVAVGYIKVHNTADPTLIYNMIGKGGNKSQVCNRMVPAGKKLLLKKWHREEGQGRRISYRIRSTDMYGVLLQGIFCFKDNGYVSKVGDGFDLTQVVPAGSIVKVSGWAIAADGEASCGYIGELVDD